MKRSEELILTAKCGKSPALTGSNNVLCAYKWEYY